jgi:hypothetical protein
MRRSELILHLIGEISSFILDGEPSRMVISLHQEEDGLHLCALDDTPRSPEQIEAIRASLNAGKRPELAAYYGSMAGQSLLGGSRLNLIGWQVKQGTVTALPEGIKIDLWIGGERFDPATFSINT